jgi:tetratricopeptide (TPR) repeat protein
LKRLLARADADFQAQRYDQAEIEYLNAIRVAPQNPIAIGRLGLIFFQQGRMPQAYGALNQAVMLDPENVEYRAKLCMTLFSACKLAEARQEATNVLLKLPGQEDALAVLADCAVTTNQIRETRKQIETMQNRDKDRAAYHLALGMLQLREGASTNAVAEIRKALDLEPQSPAANAILGSVYLGKTDLTNAEIYLRKAAEFSSIRSPRRLNYALFKSESGRTDQERAQSLAEAKEMVEEITRKAPDYLPAWNCLGRLAYDERKYDECAGYLQRVLAKDPMNLEAVSLNGVLMITRGQIAEAISQLERLKGIYSGAKDVYYELALAYLAHNEPSKAVSCLDQALLIDPNYPDAALLLAEVTIRRREPASAIPLLTQLIKTQPQFVQAYFCLAEAYVKQGNLDQAIGIYRGVQKGFPANTQSRYLLAFYLAKHADMLDVLNKSREAQTNRVEAREACNKALALEPDFLPPLEVLVDLDLAEKHPDNALARIDQEIARRPAVPLLLLLQAKIYHDQNNPKDAETALLKAIEMAPNLRSAYQLLSELYLNSNRPELALQQLQTFFSRTNDLQVLLQIGMIHDRMTNYTAARDTYEKLLAIEPKYLPALNNLSYLYAERLNQLDKAVELAERARNLRPTEPGTLDTLGWVFAQKPDYSKALPLLEEAANGLPREAEVQFHLGMVRYGLGQEDAARQALEIAVSDKKDFPGKPQAQQCLLMLAINPKTADAATRALLEKRLADKPDDVIALARLAGIYSRDGDADKAAKAYERCLSQNPKNASVLLQLAQLYVGPLKNPQKALSLANDAHAAAPENAAISELLGHLVLQNGEFRWAATLLQEAASILPNRPQLLYDLAWSSYYLGRVPEALTTMRKALQTGASFAQADKAQLFLDVVSASDDPAQCATAGSLLQQATKTDPDYLPGLMLSAAMAQQKSNFDATKQTLERVLGKYPLFSPAARDFTLLCMEHFPNQPRLFDLASKARQAFPDDPQLAKALGIITFERAEYSRASQLLRESSSSLKDDANTFYFLGMSEYRLNKPDESKKALRQALSLQLDQERAEIAKQTLAELDKSQPKSL